MGLFATYAGFIYNDFFSISLNLFGSCYNDGERHDKNCVYRFGIDPVWGISSNDVSFVNSYKMKLSVIFGVAQMMLGIVLKGFNAIYFKKKLDFYFEFLPQFIFMTCTFFYMDLLIIIK